MSMDSFLAEVTRREDSKKDYMVGPRKMMMHENGLAIGIDGIGDREVLDYAHGQLATRLGIPKTYYDKTMSVPGLRAYNVNALLNVDERKTFVRTMDGSARAFLSDAFKPIDNFLVLSAALPALKEFQDLQVVSSQLSDSRMYLQVVFPRLTGEVSVGDVVQSGLILTNSEVGAGKVDVSSVIWRLRCGNGMVGQSILNTRHVGRRVGDEIQDYDIFAAETIKAELESFRLRLRDILKASMTEAAFQKTLDGFRVKAGQMIEAKKVESAVENVTRHFTMTQDEGKAILSNLWTTGERSRWGLANAVTALVHDTVVADRQYDLEKVGYEVMAMPDATWTALVA